MRACWQQGVMGNHAQPRNAHSEFEAIVVELLGCTVAIVRIRLKTAVTSRTRQDTHRHWQGVNHLHRLLVLTRATDKLLLDMHLHLPKVGSLPYKRAPFGQFWKEMAVIAMKMLIDGFILVQSEALATDFHRHHLFIRKGWRKPSFADRLLPTDFVVFVAYHTVHMNDKIFSIH